MRGSVALRTKYVSKRSPTTADLPANSGCSSRAAAKRLSTPAISWAASRGLPSAAPAVRVILCHGVPNGGWSPDGAIVGAICERRSYSWRVIPE